MFLLDCGDVGLSDVSLLAEFIGVNERYQRVGYFFGNVGYFMHLDVALVLVVLVAVPEDVIDRLVSLITLFLNELSIILVFFISIYHVVFIYYLFLSDLPNIIDVIISKLIHRQDLVTIFIHFIKDNIC